MIPTSPGPKLLALLLLTSHSSLSPSPVAIFTKLIHSVQSTRGQTPKASPRRPFLPNTWMGGGWGRGKLVWFRDYFTRLSLVLLRQGECVFLMLPAGGTSPASRVVVWHLSTGENPSLPVAVAWYHPGGVLECRSASPGRNSGLSVCSAMLCVGTIFLRCLSGEEQLLSKKLSVFLSCSFSGSNNTIELNLSRSLSPSLAVYDYAIVTVETLFAILYLYLFLLELKVWETAILISILICIYAHTNTLSLVITVNIFPPYLYRTKEIMTPIYFIRAFLNISLLLYKKPM